MKETKAEKADEKTTEAGLVFCQCPEPSELVPMEFCTCQKEELVSAESTAVVGISDVVESCTDLMDPTDFKAVENKSLKFCQCSIPSQSVQMMFCSCPKEINEIESLQESKTSAVDVCDSKTEEIISVGEFRTSKSKDSGSLLLIMSLNLNV